MLELNPALCEVRRPGDHPVGAVRGDERFAVQEPVLEAAHLHAVRAQPLHKAARRGVCLQREAQMVAFHLQVVLVVF